MRSKQHIVGIIAKKCVQLKLEKNIDAFFDFQAHVEKIEVRAYKSWDLDSNTTLFSASCCLDGGWNSDNNAMGLIDILENLDSLLTRLGFE